MVIIPASATVAEGITFTVGQITWTTRTGGLTSMTLEENQIQSEAVEMVTPFTPTTTTSAPTTLSATLTTRPSLPHYKGKRINNSDLLKAIDRVDHRLSQVSNLVNSISDQTAQAMALGFLYSPRPTRATMHEWLGTSLAIIATPKGRTIQFKTTPLNGSLPHGLSNAAD